MTKNIVIHGTEDITRINKICSRYLFDISIQSKSGIVDAKSLLGMFMLSLNEDKYIVVDDDVDSRALFEELADYIVE